MISKYCPLCKEVLRLQYTSHDEEVLEESFCSCGYYENKILSLNEMADALIPENHIPEDFKF